MLPTYAFYTNKVDLAVPVIITREHYEEVLTVFEHIFTTVVKDAKNDSRLPLFVVLLIFRMMDVHIMTTTMMLTFLESQVGNYRGNRDVVGDDDGFFPFHF
jgi:hypothetical protein